MTCETLHIWRPEDESPSLAADCDKDAAARKMYQDVSNSVVEISIPGLFSESLASGFFVGKGDEIMTNAHVAADAGSAPLDIITKDGKEYTALIESADEASDLAVLKVQGLSPGTYKPLQFRPSASMQTGEDIFVLGHPGGRSQVFISPGKLQTRGSLLTLDDQDSLRQFDTHLKSADITERTLAEKEVSAPRLESSAHTEGGSSGSPVVDLDGLVIGVHADRAKRIGSLEVPSEPAISLLNPANRTRKFEYKTEQFFLMQQTQLIGDPVRYVLSEDQ